MPNRDGTGPAGKGPRTRKGRGRCKKGKQPDQFFTKSRGGKGAGQGRGSGQGRDSGQKTNV